MIGLGSNRLSVCRRGGMSVTQAGKGGMEWLAGFRAPSWASPYSAQATAALKAQFPTQWPTIRDYGFAHPEIVGYMNAYAPEDAKIAYSLVEGIGTRWLKGDTYAYINTGYTPNIETITETVMRYDESNTGGEWFTFGTGTGGSDTCYRLQGNQVGARAWAASGVSTGTYFVAGHAYKIYLYSTRGEQYLIVDGTKYPIGNVTTANPGGPALIFTMYYNGGPYTRRLVSFGQLRIKEGTTDIRYFVPFKRNGAMGMIDLLTGTFYGNANSSGAFTESIETPAS